MLDSTSWALSGLGLLLVTLALALWERRKKGSFSAMPQPESDTISLRQAAQLAYDYAKTQGSPLAAVAERSGDATGWFANSVLKTVSVSATLLNTGTIQVLAAGTRARMCAVPGGIAKTSGGEPIYSDPTVRAKDFKKYMRWLRSVW